MTLGKNLGVGLGGSSGGGATGHATYALLAAALNAGEIGDTAELRINGDGALVGKWVKVAENVDPHIALQLDGEADLSVCTGSQFSEGAEGSGADIETDGTISWSSGMVVDGSDVYLRCFGTFTGQGAISIHATVVPVTITGTAGQRVLIGTAANSDSEGSMFGVEYNSGWKRCDRNVGNTFGNIYSDTAFAEGTETLLHNSQAAANSSSGSAIGGGFTAGDSGTSYANLTNNGRIEAEHADHQVIIRVQDAANDCIVNFKSVKVISSSPAA